jgi:predicted transcriptional regulator
MRQEKDPATARTNETLQRTPKARSGRYRIHVIDRAAQILDCFGFDHQELSVSEIGVKTHLHRSTAHRILMALEYNDLIQQNPENGKYRLGIKLFRLGHQAVSHLNLREICRPFLTRIMNETKETVHLWTKSRAPTRSACRPGSAAVFRLIARPSARRCCRVWTIRK